MPVPLAQSCVVCGFTSRAVARTLVCHLWRFKRYYFCPSLRDETDVTDIPSCRRRFNARATFPSNKAVMGPSDNSLASYPTHIPLHKRHNACLCQPCCGCFRCDISDELLQTLHRPYTDPANPSPYCPPDVADTDHPPVLGSGRHPDLVSAMECRWQKPNSPPIPRPGKGRVHRNSSSLWIWREVVRILHTSLRAPAQVSKNPADGVRVQYLGPNASSARSSVPEHIRPSSCRAREAWVPFQIIDGAKLTMASA